MATSNYKIAVFISGGGSNFKAIHSAIQNGDIAAEIAFVLGSTKNAGGLSYANQNEITHFVPDAEIFTDESVFAELLLQKTKEYDVKLVVLAGFLKKIPARFIHDFSGNIINIHPALLPSFGGKGMYGRHVHKAVLEYGCKISGATVHLVNSGYDTGAPIVQRSVPVLPGDTPETLAERILKIEHEILPETVAAFAADKIKIDGRHIYIE
ncbi:MAG: phosphoribosylglycinamide formyltransferase [Calditrichaeota bacterium]|nr:MAG: phosphoribosylglycinamide formyltransferase [Calditrichota bacterium]